MRFHCLIFSLSYVLDFYDSMIFISRVGHREKRLLKLKVLLEKLPKVNFETFKFLSHHLHNVSSHWDVNKVCLNIIIC